MLNQARPTVATAISVTCFPLLGPYLRASLSASKEQVPAIDVQSLKYQPGFYVIMECPLEHIEKQISRLLKAVFVAFY